MSYLLPFNLAGPIIIDPDVGQIVTLTLLVNGSSTIPAYITFSNLAGISVAPDTSVPSGNITIKTTLNDGLCSTVQNFIFEVNSNATFKPDLPS